MTPSRTERPWIDVATRHLLDARSCPVCEDDALFDRHCRNCGAELTEDVAVELWAASQAAVEALRTREKLLGRVHRSARGRVAPPAEIASSVPQSTTGQRRPAQLQAVVAAPRSSATVQSVLAVAGAGLFAVSALVFTFFNPDLTDHGVRSLVVALITILFLVGAWLLVSRGLQFSAEAVGSLGMVFVALDVYAFTELAPLGVSPWTLAAVGTLVCGAAMAAVAALAGIRSWLWISLCGLATVPAMVGYAGGSALSATLGHVAVGFAALALMAVIARLAGRFDGPLRPERTTVATIQIVAIGIALAQVWFIIARTPAEFWLTITAVLAAVAVLGVLACRLVAPRLWSAVAGAAGMAAAICVPFAFDLGARGEAVWYLAITPAVAAAALLTLSVFGARPRVASQPAFLGGVFALAGVSVLATVLMAVQIGALTVLSALGGSTLGVRGLVQPDSVITVVLGLAAMSVGLGAFSVITKPGRATRLDGMPADTDSARLSAATGSGALWLAALAGLVLACLTAVPLWSRIAIALGLAVAVSSAIAAVPFIRNAALIIRVPMILGAHFAVLLAIINSLADERVTVWAGIAIVGVIAIIVLPVAPRLRFLYVGAGYAYALVIFAIALDQMGVGTLALLCLTTSLASVGAIGATFLRRVTPPAWYAILTVTSVPFLIGVVQVIFERSGWTALSTALISLLALTLLVSRRAGLGVALRAIAAGLLVPSLAVVVVCLGAQVLLGSASPVTLPIIAFIVAIVLPSTGLIGSVLRARGIGVVDATAARIAVEASALLTGAIAVVLALVRDAAGLPTTLTVLVVLGLGAAATSLWAKRRYGWWVAAAAFTGALWCLWAIVGVFALEPYLLPPSLAAAVIALILTARGSGALPLYATGLVMAVAPALAVLAFAGSGAGALAPWRGYGLIAASWLLLGAGVMLGRNSGQHIESLRTLRHPTLAVAIAAGAAGAIQGVRFGTGADQILTGGMPLVLCCVGVGVAGALPAAAAGRVLRSSAAHGSRLERTRWVYAPPALYVALASWTAIQRDWFTIWVMWSLMVAYLVVVVLIAWRLRTRPTSMPPVWFIFGLAFITAIVAWSPRDLRVEWFSVPLGVFLLAAGAVLLRAGRKPDDNPRAGGTLSSWPAGWNGSWALLAPGLVTLLSASVVATFTDPQTWRAILVILVALIAILVGSGGKLAAPFLIGIIVLPIENVVVFAVQIGRGIESMPWWITLAVVGAVLLIIAVTYERRAGEENRITDRLRDLR